jgi:hypothetical protein
VVGVVAGVVVVSVVVVGVVSVLVEGVVVVGVVAVVVVGVVVRVLVVRQSTDASRLTVEAPWFRSWRRLVLIVDGRFETALIRPWLALLAAPQLPDATAEET